jgi:LemA protein
MSTGLWIICGMVGLILLWLISTFNSMVILRNRIDSAWSQIDVQLKRRHDLIPNLVEVVKGYASHERETFEAVVNARQAGLSAESVEEQAQAENMITQTLRQMFALAEAYPQLRASENFLQLQEELSGTESKIAYARQFYNDTVLKYHNLIQSFPANQVASLTGFKPRPYFQLEDSGERNPIAVDLQKG